MNRLDVFLAWILAFFIPIASSQADGAKTYKTSKGAVFTEIQVPGNFGKAWKDPSGTIWSEYQGDSANTATKPDQSGVIVDSPATEACAKIGGVLPTAEQYRKLTSCFDLDGNGYFTNQGRRDLYAIFPDMLDGQGNTRGFWTSSVYPYDPTVAYLFGADSGTVGSIDGYRVDSFISVRCVER